MKMFNKVFRNRMTIFCRISLAAIGLCCLLMGVSPAWAEQWHQFDVINNSSRGINIVGTVGRCVTEIDAPGFIAAGSRGTIKWHDTDNWFVMNCAGRDKFAGFSFRFDDDPDSWPGWLGVTHRELSGSDWYNGQFYAYTLSSDGWSFTYADGVPAPSWIQPLCSHGNDCSGPFSEMEVDNKNSYNWQRSYRTEDGWAFQINNP
ncbi:hypothetical protein [Paraburkholderia graminis]|uniref:Secreted protein n=1 Tax=Paraburkholderia graminis TaxID=60548 RepID=A0ABD5CGA8_9BURK|nr:hypothetical protein [Paraburkholderia graminis]MDR6203973.1 hypothetical protein [Paraburkholderia graminis]